VTTWLDGTFDVRQSTVL